MTRTQHQPDYYYIGQGELTNNDNVIKLAPTYSLLSIIIIVILYMYIQCNIVQRDKQSNTQKDILLCFFSKQNIHLYNALFP